MTDLHALAALWEAEASGSIFPRADAMRRCARDLREALAKDMNEAADVVGAYSREIHGTVGQGAYKVLLHLMEVERRLRTPPGEQP